MNQPITWSPGVTLAQIEKQVILRAYAFYRKNKTATADALGISVRTIDNKFAEYAKEEEAGKTNDARRKADKEHQLARARGQIQSSPAEQIAAKPAPAPHPSAEGLRSKPVAVASQESAVSLPKREEVQDVLPRQASTGGARKAR